MNESGRQPSSFFSTIGTLRTSRPRPSGLDLFKYVMRGLFAIHAHNAWARFLAQRIVGGQTRAQAQPHLLWKLQRPYLTSEVGLRQKLAWLREHHDWMATNLPVDLVARLYLRGTVDLARHNDDTSTIDYTWCLAFEPQFAKEGELVIKLVRSTGTRQDRLVALAFTVHRERDRWVAHIGCVQGPSSPHAADWIRQATKDFHGLRPMVAAVVALLAVCRSSGLEQVRAIAQAEHIYGARWRRRDRVKFNYDGFWAELGGVRDAAGWQLPPNLPHKSFADIASQKRAQYRRRFALEDDLSRQISTTIGPRGLAIDGFAAGAAPAAAISAYGRPANTPALAR